MLELGKALVLGLITIRGFVSSGDGYLARNTEVRGTERVSDDNIRGGKTISRSRRSCLSDARGCDASYVSLDAWSCADVACVVTSVAAETKRRESLGS